MMRFGADENKTEQISQVFEPCVIGRLTLGGYQPVGRFESWLEHLPLQRREFQYSASDRDFDGLHCAPQKGISSSAISRVPAGICAIGAAAGFGVSTIRRTRRRFCP